MTEQISEKRTFDYWGLWASLKRPVKELLMTGIPAVGSFFVTQYPAYNVLFTFAARYLLGQIEFFFKTVKVKKD